MCGVRGSLAPGPLGVRMGGRHITVCSLYVGTCLVYLTASIDWWLRSCRGGFRTRAARIFFWFLLFVARFLPLSNSLFMAVCLLMVG